MKNQHFENALEKFKMDMYLLENTDKNKIVISLTAGVYYVEFPVEMVFHDMDKYVKSYTETYKYIQKRVLGFRKKLQSLYIQEKWSGVEKILGKYELEEISLIFVIIRPKKYTQEFEDFIKDFFENLS